MINTLLVEDHELYRMGLSMLLDKAEGITLVAESADGLDGIKKAREFSPDVILMDIGFPDISGIKAAKSILDKNPSLKIIVLTSHTDVSEVTAALSLGIYAYVVKDINTEILKMVIKSVNEGAVWLDPHIVPAIRNKGGTTLPIKQTGRAAFRSQHANLTEREYEVLKLVVDGKSNNDIANLLSISEHTAKAHVCNIIQKLVVDDRTQAAVKALKEGII